ncbi:aminotransferase class IV family protein [Streptomyces calidiresistens]|uniref:Aminotransferase n=1 Tax=Streptomyces calidiresistens TaxID=1485586 RepID=A0A7W3T3U5_9ACTN|nr:aminotransferase class IV [Streptomyces calidiresistens]MBB0230293.1 aminotransferase [Streptomyces calidiresistens]
MTQPHGAPGVPGTPAEPDAGGADRPAPLPPPALLDGRAVEPEELRALALTGYGHFTTLRVEDGRVRGLDLHLERLTRDGRALFGTAPDPGWVRELLRRSLALYPGATGGEPPAVTARITVFDPALDIARPETAGRPAVLVTLRPVPAAGEAPAALRLRTVRCVRELPEIKHTALLGALHRRREVRRAGWDDALFVDAAGLIAEGPTWNIGLCVTDPGPAGGRAGAARVVWPRAAALPGVTAALLRERCRVGGDHAHVPVRRDALPRVAGGVVRAAFVTNAAVGVRPVAAVDDLDLDPAHPLIGELAERYRALPGDVV